MRLSACQRDAAGGLYAQATAGYIQWLAPRLDQVRAEYSIGADFVERRATITKYCLRYNNAVESSMGPQVDILDCLDTYLTTPL